jgi:hypothetical protein
MFLEDCGCHHCVCVCVWVGVGGVGGCVSVRLCGAFVLLFVYEAVCDSRDLWCVCVCVCAWMCVKMRRCMRGCVCGNVCVCVCLRL